MKKIALLVSVLVITVVFTAFKDKHQNAGTYKIDQSKSGVTWIGKKVIGSHNGTIQIKEGSAHFNGERLTSGTFVIDMTSIQCLDLEGEKKKKLENHLMSPDFFEAGKYPATTFTLKKVEQDNFEGGIATGMLTIKETTREISFPFTVKVKDKRMELTANNVKVDRTKFGVVYGSKSLKGSLGDKAIDDEFTISFSLVLFRSN